MTIQSRQLVPDLGDGALPTSGLLLANPGYMLANRIVPTERLYRREPPRESHLVVEVVKAPVAQLADVDALLELGSTMLPFETVAAVDFAGDQVMKGETALAAAQGAPALFAASFPIH